MKKVLIAYTTNSGSTEDVARVISEELGKTGTEVTLSRLENVTTVQGYDAVIIGAPMILGWHRAARNFIHQHEANLKKVPVAYFCTAMSLTTKDGDKETAVPVFLDPGLAKPSRHGWWDIKENYTLVSNYLNPILGAAKEVRPVSVGFFGGKLELFRLKLLQMLFVMVIIGAKPADMRNWDVIREWARSLVGTLIHE